MPLELHLPRNKTALVRTRSVGEESHNRQPKKLEDEQRDGWGGRLLRESQRDRKAQAFYLNIWIIFEYQMIAIFSACLSCRTHGRRLLLCKSELPQWIKAPLYTAPRKWAPTMWSSLDFIVPFASSHSPPPLTDTRPRLLTFIVIKMYRSHGEVLGWGRADGSTWKMNE